MKILTDPTSLPQYSHGVHRLALKYIFPKTGNNLSLILVLPISVLDSEKCFSVRLRIFVTIPNPSGKQRAYKNRKLHRNCWFDVRLVLKEGLIDRQTCGSTDSEVM